MAEENTAKEKATSGNNPEVKSAGNQDEGKEQDEKQSYLKDLMAISGYSGLFKFVSQARNGIIVESIETGKRMNAFSTMKVSALEDIAVFTEEKEIPLEEVLDSIHQYEQGGEAISPKSDPDELRDYFSAVLPGYDRERVYISDIKKVLTWYNQLLKHDLIGKEGEETAGKEKAPQAAAEKKPAAKTGAVKDESAPPQNSDTAGSDA
jgi:hypothetical protein